MNTCTLFRYNETKGLLMKLLLLVALISLFTMLYSADTRGFRELKWGDSPKILSDKLVLIQKNSALKMSVYERKNENLKIADATLYGIRYYFFDNKFCWTTVGFKNTLNSAKLKKTFDGRYGNPFSINTSILDQYQWLGGNSVLSMRYNKINDKGDVIIGNMALMQQAEAYKTSSSYH